MWRERQLYEEQNTLMNCAEARTQACKQKKPATTQENFSLGISRDARRIAFVNVARYRHSRAPMMSLNDSTAVKRARHL